MNSVIPVLVAFLVVPPVIRWLIRKGHVHTYSKQELTNLQSQPYSSWYKYLIIFQILEFAAVLAATAVFGFLALKTNLIPNLLRPLLAPHAVFFFSKPYQMYPVAIAGFLAVMYFGFAMIGVGNTLLPPRVKGYLGGHNPNRLRVDSEASAVEKIGLGVGIVSLLIMLVVLPFYDSVTDSGISYAGSYPSHKVLPWIDVQRLDLRCFVYEDTNNKQNPTEVVAVAIIAQTTQGPLMLTSRDDGQLPMQGVSVSDIHNLLDLVVAHSIPVSKTGVSTCNGFPLKGTSLVQYRAFFF